MVGGTQNFGVGLVEIAPYADGVVDAEFLAVVVYIACDGRDAFGKLFTVGQRATKGIVAPFPTRIEIDVEIAVFLQKAVHGIGLLFNVLGSEPVLTVVVWGAHGFE